MLPIKKIQNGGRIQNDGESVFFLFFKKKNPCSQGTAHLKRFGD
jgi:hypothetical protein